MLDIEKVDHIGIRVRDKGVSIAFYERLGVDGQMSQRIGK